MSAAANLFPGTLLGQLRSPDPLLRGRAAQELAASARPAQVTPDTLAEINRRRAELIRLDLAGRLDEAGRQELDALDRFVDAVAESRSSASGAAVGCRPPPTASRRELRRSAQSATRRP